MIIAHGPLSAITIEVVRKKFFKKTDKRLLPTVLILSLITGILPDFDFFILAARSMPSFIHHSLITHTPIFWLIVTGASYLVIKLVEKYSRKGLKEVLQNGGSELLACTLLIGTMSHMIADLVTGHIMLLYPISDYAFTITGDTLRINPTVSYYFHPFMVLELAIISTFIITILRMIFPISKEYIKRIISISSVIILALLLLTLDNHLNTYNPNIQRHSNNMINNDIDSDGIIDFKDHDTNDNGRDNVEDIDRSKLVDNLDRIVKSNKRTVLRSNFDSSFLERIGYLSSYSLISTTYFESGYPLEPVIKKVLRKSNDYDEKVPYNLDSYYKTLKTKGRLKTISVEDIGRSNIGYTLFIVNKGYVVNAGIVTSTNKIAIITELNKDAMEYSLEEVIKHYSEITSLEIEIEGQQ